MRNAIGKLSFSESGLYLTFKEFYAVEPSTMEIIAAFDGANIIIQNYGNSMNNYMKFNECGGKYLNFEKQKR